ncbi:MAG: DNA repair protein RecO, partial [Proteobacteria bacterium SW_6_67_9]
REYDFLPEHGPVAAVGPPGPSVVRLPGAHLLALAGHSLDDAAALRSARRVLRASLAPLLGSKPLKSRELYRSMYGGDRA